MLLKYMITSDDVFFYEMLYLNLYLNSIQRYKLIEKNEINQELGLSYYHIWIIILYYI